MIQRIQSLYLLLATSAYVCLFFFPFASFTNATRTLELSILGLTEGSTLNKGMVPLLAGVILMIFMTLIIIFMYKKRMTQSRLTAVTLLMNVALIAGVFFYCDSIGADLQARANYEVGSYIVVVPIVFLVLANRAIRKDELRVRAADRLR